MTLFRSSVIALFLLFFTTLSYFYFCSLAAPTLACSISRSARHDRYIKSPHYESLSSAVVYKYFSPHFFAYRLGRRMGCYNSTILGLYLDKRPVRMRSGTYARRLVFVTQYTAHIVYVSSVFYKKRCSLRRSSPPSS